MSKPGPKTKLTSEVRERLLMALRGGNFRATACQWAGVSYRSFAEWMQRGKEQPTSDLGEFRRAVIEAEKLAEIRAVGLVMKAAENDPKHAQWWLTHRYPQRWSEKRVTQKVEHTHSLDALTDEQIEARFKELMQTAAEKAAAGDDEDDTE